MNFATIVRDYKLKTEFHFDNIPFLKVNLPQILNFLHVTSVKLGNIKVVP